MTRSSSNSWPNSARACALGIGTVALAFASVADAAVYKCTSASGAVTYQDFLCSGGAVVEIRTGKPDPTAIERLDRANADFDRRAAARAQNEESAALRREELDLRRRELEAAQGAAAEPPPAATYVPAYAYPGYGYPGYGRPGHRPPSPPAKRHASRAASVVPNGHASPTHVPRRDPGEPIHEKVDQRPHPR
ncbi:MAG: DUF4124 domain-containing protein [Candidatus Levyibacteriota bacterium]